MFKMKIFNWGNILFGVKQIKKTNKEKRAPDTYQRKKEVLLSVLKRNVRVCWSHGVERSVFRRRTKWHILNIKLYIQSANCEKKTPHK